LGGKTVGGGKIQGPGEDNHGPPELVSKGELVRLGKKLETWEHLEKGGGSARVQGAQKKKGGELTKT